MIYKFTYSAFDRVQDSTSMYDNAKNHVDVKVYAPTEEQALVNVKAMVTRDIYILSAVKECKSMMSAQGPA